MTRGVDGGVPCLVSILRYFNVAYLNCLFSPMSHAVLNKSLCGMSLFFKPMSHVTRTHVNLFNLRNDCVTMLIFFFFLFVFSPGLVQLYIAGLPLRSCPDPWVSFWRGVPNV